MKKILRHINNQLAHIRASDDTTKTIWLYGLTTLCALVVIGLWVAYERATLPMVNRPANVPLVQQAPALTPGIAETLRVGFTTITASLGNRFSKGLALIQDAFLGNGNIITVSDNDRNFILEGLPPAEKGKLPK